MLAPADPRLLASLGEVVGPDHLLVDPDVVRSYVLDWTGRFRGESPAVVRPGSTAEVAEVVRRCAAHGVSLVPQGGNTGLVGGGVPLSGELVLSLRRLGAPPVVDPAAGQLTASAGTTLAEVQRAASTAGWAYGVDLGSRDSATVGGTIATNAGGLRLLRYGDTRAQVLGVEAVLGRGEVVSHLGGLLKDNTGYHLATLLCGSEGTLGVVTAARLRLVPATEHRVVALLGFDVAGSAVAAAQELRRGVEALAAAELFLRDGLELVMSATGAADPFVRPFAAYLLVEAAAAATDPTSELAQAIGSLPAVGDVAVATDSVRASELWRLREAHPEVVNALGAPHKLDVTLPADRLASFMEEVPAAVASVAPGTRTWLWGHVADGNIHVNLTGAAPDDERPDDAVLQLVAAAGGSISAEHGIGTAKKPWLHLNRTEAELVAFARIKGALDPDGVLNPNVLLPTAG